MRGMPFSCSMASFIYSVYKQCHDKDLLPLSLPPSAEHTAAIQKAVTEAKAHAKLREDARKARHTVDQENTSNK